jgi:hypothetical protein
VRHNKVASLMRPERLRYLNRDRLGLKRHSGKSSWSTLVSGS